MSHIVKNPDFSLCEKKGTDSCAQATGQKGYLVMRLKCFLPIVSISYYKPQLCLVRYNQLFAYEQTKGVLLHRLIRVNIFSLPR